MVFEIDQPQVLEFARTLAQLVPPRLPTPRTIPVDLRYIGHVNALRDNGFNPPEPTAWIAEGFIYLLPEAQTACRTTSSPYLLGACSRLATEHMDAKALTTGLTG